MTSEGVKRYSAEFVRERMLWICILLTSLVASTWLNSHRSTIHYTNDAVQYWSVTNNLLEGRGVRTSTIYYEVQANQGMPANQTVWPPGLPLVAALTSKVTGLSSAEAISVVNSGSHGATVVLLFWIISRLRRGFIVAAIISCSYAIYAPALKLVLQGLAESLLFLLVIGSVFCLVKALERDRHPSFRWLVVASLTIGAASWARYQGIVLMVPFSIVCFLILSRQKSLLTAAIGTACLALPAAGAFLALTIRNLILTGRATGGNYVTQGNSLSDLFQQAKWAAMSLVGIGSDWITRLLALLMIFTAVSWLISRVVHAERFQLPQDDLRRFVGLYGALAAAFTMVLVLGLASSSTFYILEDRYFIPAGLLGLIGALALLPISKPVRATIFNRGIGFSFLASALALHVMHTASMRHWIAAGGEQIHLTRALSIPIGGRTAHNFLLESASFASPIMSNQSQLLHLILDRPTIGVPQRRLTTLVWNTDDILAAAVAFGVRHIVSFRKTPVGSRDGSTDYIWQLGEKGDPRLIVLAISDELVVFALARNR